MQGCQGQPQPCQSLRLSRVDTGRAQAHAGLGWWPCSPLCGLTGQRHAPCTDLEVGCRGPEWMKSVLCWVFVARILNLRHRTSRGMGEQKWGVGGAGRIADRLQEFPASQDFFLRGTANFFGQCPRIVIPHSQAGLVEAASSATAPRTRYPQQVRIQRV